MTNNKLKPCPFCGGEAKFHLCANLENETLRAVYSGYGIHCCKCGTATPPHESKELAIEAWNNRADTLEHLTDKEVDEIEKEIKELK